MEDGIDAGTQQDREQHSVGAQQDSEEQSAKERFLNERNDHGGQRNRCDRRPSHTEQRPVISIAPSALQLLRGDRAHHQAIDQLGDDLEVEAWAAHDGIIEQVRLRLVAGGLSNDEIAHQLYVSLNTVKRHNANIFGKLCVKGSALGETTGLEDRLLLPTARRVLREKTRRHRVVAGLGAEVNRHARDDTRGRPARPPYPLRGGSSRPTACR